MINSKMHLKLQDFFGNYVPAFLPDKVLRMNWSTLYRSNLSTTLYGKFDGLKSSLASDIWDNAKNVTV